jgi:hypothetical protein
MGRWGRAWHASGHGGDHGVVLDDEDHIAIVAGGLFESPGSVGA